MVLGLFEKTPGYSYAGELREIRETGADHVSLVVTWYQKDIRSDEIYPRWSAAGDFETIPDEQLARVIDGAHRSGLKVMLFPVLRIEERKEKEWRGVIAPKNPEIWLKSYQRFIDHYARMAGRHRVVLFSIGSELCSMEDKAEFWSGLIESIRKTYGGKLIYSANWDHYKKIPFWDKLDYLGINGYYEIASGPKVNITDVVFRWWSIENELASWQERYHKKIIFTEIGYPSMDGGCQKPWDYTRDAPVDLEEQAACYQAFFLSWGKSQKLGGVYFWNWFGTGGQNDRTYTPRGKPAEKVLRQWFKKENFSLLLPP